jgi:hypothetical protein
MGQLLLHLKSPSLHPNLRVGFSLLNLTGQSIRYLQHWEGGVRTIEYLADGERGLLNFMPSQTIICNNNIVEKSFDVQIDPKDDKRNQNHGKSLGNKVTLQVCGYQWLRAIQADELGLHYETLMPILGRLNPANAHLQKGTNDALVLLIEVVPYNGGRMMILKSVFEVRNNTNHPVRILARSDDSDYAGVSSTNSTFDLLPGESLHLPLSLLRRSLLNSTSKSLGELFIQPKNIHEIRDELKSRLGVAPGYVDPSYDSINLFSIITNNNSGDNDIDKQPQSEGFFLNCHINHESTARMIPNKTASKKNELAVVDRDATSPIRFPPFCYSVEILSKVIQSRTLKSPKNSAMEVPRNFSIGKLIEFCEIHFQFLFSLYSSSSTNLY